MFTDFKKSARPASKRVLAQSSTVTCVPARVAAQSALSVLAGVTESVAAGAGRLKLQQGYRRMEGALMRARNAPGRDGADSKVETQEEQQNAEPPKPQHLPHKVLPR